MSDKRFLKELANHLHKLVDRDSLGATGTLQRNSRDLAGFLDSAEGMISFEEALLLYRLALEVTHGCIVEVGSYRGRSAVALGRGSLDGAKVPVFAFEPHEELSGVVGGHFGPKDRAGFYRTMLDTGCYKIVRLINLSSELVAPNWSQEIGLLWIDGDRRYAGVKRDFECWSPFLSRNAKIGFGDSLDPDDGPSQLISELVQSQHFRKVQQVDDLTVLAATGSSPE